MSLKFSGMIMGDVTTPKGTTIPVVEEPRAIFYQNPSSHSLTWVRLTSAEVTARIEKTDPQISMAELRKAKCLLAQHEARQATLFKQYRPKPKSTSRRLAF